MLPTPDTSHVAFERIYEPAEDSYLLLDTLSSEGQRAFLTQRFGPPSEAAAGRPEQPALLIAEIGTGSGVVLAFVNAHAELIFGRADVLTLGVDVNGHACRATEETVKVAAQEQVKEHKSYGHYVGNVVGDLTASLKDGGVDVLVFNPPYVPTPELPDLPEEGVHGLEDGGKGGGERSQWDIDSHLLSLSYAGGADGMEATDRLLESLQGVLSNRGVAYILLCAQNKPDLVKDRIRSWGQHWDVQTVGSSGKKAGWEKLVIIRIARVIPGDWRVE